MARLTGHEITVRTWEGHLGREGLWCKRCRHQTPVALLVVAEQRALLVCERCSRPLLTGESWLADVDRRVPRQASAVVEVS